MHAHEKIRAGETAAMGYCPLDLFSGERERVSKALSNLWEAWVQSDGRINNLKVFVEGALIQPSQVGYLPTFPSPAF